jgi:hypothetical protein
MFVPYDSKSLFTPINFVLFPTSRNRFQIIFSSNKKKQKDTNKNCALYRPMKSWRLGKRNNPPKEIRARRKQKALVLVNGRPHMLHSLRSGPHNLLRIPHGLLRRWKAVDSTEPERIATESITGCPRVVDPRAALYALKQSMPAPLP